MPKEHGMVQEICQSQTTCDITTIYAQEFEEITPNNYYMCKVPVIID